MNIESTNPCHDWEFNLTQSNPRTICATECKIETIDGGLQMSTTEWNSRRHRVALTGKATAKAKNAAYAALLELLLANGCISQSAFDNAPKIFS